MCVHVFIWEWMNKRENLLFFGCILYLSYFIPHGECWWDSIWIRGHKMTLLTVIYVRFLTFQCINVYIVTTSTFVFFKLKIQVTRGRRIIWLCYMISGFFMLMTRRMQPIGCYFCNWWCECFMTIYLSFMNVENLLKNVKFNAFVLCFLWMVMSL